MDLNPRIYGVWEGNWTFDGKDQGPLESELSIGGKGQKVKYSYIGQGSAKFEYLVENEVTFFFISPSSGRKFIFSLVDEETLEGYRADNPKWRVKMTKKQ